jgi:hypothetical protein
MKITGANYHGAFASVTVESGATTTQESITTPQEARALQREMFQVIEELEDFARLHGKKCSCSAFVSEAK